MDISPPKQPLPRDYGTLNRATQSSALREPVGYIQNERRANPSLGPTVLNFDS